LEYLSDDQTRRPIQIFATDASRASIEKARAGRYPENIAGEVSQERLRRFFAKVDSGYQIKETVRQRCTFANQNVTRDPPFSHLDLVSCRNLLIYMGAALQKKIVPTFHYALRPGGYLMLGTAETIGDFADLFSLVDKKNKIYAKKPSAVRPPLEFGVSEGLAREAGGDAPPSAPPAPLDLERELSRIMLVRYSPAAVMVNDKMEIVRFHGQTGRYLEPAPGAASLSLLKMVRPGLAMDLRNLLQKVKSSRAPARAEGLRVKHNGTLLTVDVEVVPVEPGRNEPQHYLVVFRESPAPPPVTKSAPRSPGKAAPQALAASQREVDDLRTELAVTKESLQAIIEEHEATNEELRAANEEIQSSNEELQSTNEELTTAKEELQSTNEELTTLNEELETRNTELRQALGDLNNLLNSVNIPILILDNDLRIRFFTPLAEAVFKLIPADCGRPIGELRLGGKVIPVESLQQRIINVIQTLEVHEEDVQAEDGRMYSLRIRPYRTTDDKISGAVLALFDVSEDRQAVTRNTRLVAEKAVATVHEPALVLDDKLCVVAASAAFYQIFRVGRQETEGRRLYELGRGQWDIPALRAALEEIIPQNAWVRDYRVEQAFPDIGARTMLVNGCRIDAESNAPPLIFLAIKDVTDEQEG